MKLRITIGTWQIEADGDAAEVNAHAVTFYRLCAGLVRAAGDSKIQEQALLLAADPKAGAQSH